MDSIEYTGFSERYMKALDQEERQRIFNYLDGLPYENALLVLDIGKQFYNSSVVNGTWFWRTVPVLAEELPEEEIGIWLEEGARICRGSWESALSFMKASPDIAKSVNSVTFLNWVKIGRILVRFSNHDAIWVFKHSENILKKLDQYYQQLLTDWVLKIIEHSWQTAVSCLKSWTEITCYAEEDNIENLLELGLKLATDIPDDAPAYFLALPAFLQKFGNDLPGIWVETAYRNIKGRRGLVSEYFKSTPGLALKLSKQEFSEQVVRWAIWGRRLTSIDSRVAEEFFKTTPQILKGFDWVDIEKWVSLIEQVNEKQSYQEALEFTKSTAELAQQLEIKEVAGWVEYGLNTINSEKRLAYFLLKSQESRDAISRFRTGLHMESVKKILLLYYEGLTGETVVLRNATDLPGKIHGDERLFGTLDTRRIYLPAVIKSFEDEQDNLRLYRAMLMHLAAHREFGTLELNNDDFRKLAANRYMGLLFEYIEDNRVDYLAMQKYPGMGKDFRILVETTVDKNEKIIQDNQILYCLKYYLWSDIDLSEDLASNKIRLLLREFWANVLENGASAQASLQVARKISKIIADEGIQQQYFLTAQNLMYRGKIKYDLLHTSIMVDEEIGQDTQKSGKQANDLTDSGNIEFDGIDLQSSEGHFNPHSEFYIWLKKRLHKFFEDEENPYRMVAYYDEWDRTLNDYKKDWCKVREILLKPSTGKFVTQTVEENYGMINTLKRYFGMLRPDRFRRFTRQEDGDDIDVDAVIEAMVEMKAGVSSEGGFYVRRDKRERDVAVGFLLDLSYSTEEKISETKTLLDVEKQSVIVMAEALEVLGDKYAIYGFNSDGRDKVNFYVVKDFEEAYTPEIKQRFGGFQSYGMTRLAAAVRHALFKLEKVQAVIKILILLSDGRPFDFDYNSGLSKDYEPLYSETDTRMALREAKMKGINPFCITVDRDGQQYMDYIFGNVSYIIIDDVNALPTKLTETYKNLTT